MTLIEQIECQYNQAIRSLELAYKHTRDSSQSRYDARKSIAIHGAGYVPKKYTSRLEKDIHALNVEKRWQLKGVLAALDFIDELPEDRMNQEIKDLIHKEVGDVLELLEGRT